MIPPNFLITNSKEITMLSCLYPQSDSDHGGSDCLQRFDHQDYSSSSLAEAKLTQPTGIESLHHGPCHGGFQHVFRIGLRT